MGLKINILMLINLLHRIFFSCWLAGPTYGISVQFHKCSALWLLKQSHLGDSLLFILKLLILLKLSFTMHCLPHTPQPSACSPDSWLFQRVLGGRCMSVLMYLPFHLPGTHVLLGLLSSRAFSG